MKIAVLRESSPGEIRVALTPGSAQTLIKKGVGVRVQKGCGAAAGFPDALYEAASAELAESPADTLAGADIALAVRVNEHSPEFAPGQIVIAHADPYTSRSTIDKLCASNSSLLALELVPRITRAQSMDALSSQAMVGGYQAVLLGAMKLPRMLPMMMTAAGTVHPAKVFVIGAGVAGLQALSTAKRLGAVASGYDVRPAVREQVESLGAKFVQFDVGGGEGAGGYAKELTPEQQAMQRQLMSDTIAGSDIVITTALVPGRPAPKLIPADAVKRMAPGSVIVDLAAERGGNCELTRPGETFTCPECGVTIVGLTNYAALAPGTASQLLSGNFVNLLKHLLDKQGNLRFDLAAPSDEIVTGMLVCHGGQVVHAGLRKAFGLETPAAVA
ncbi:MAG: NAD(P) transhydrogenase subunit alpha [Tepidisphaeraceae bacterium]